MDYLGVTIKLHQDVFELISAVLDGLGFEGIYEEEGKITAYIPAKNYKKTDIAEQANLLGIALSAFEIIAEENIEERNWNAEWEKNFEPVLVEDKCVVRAPFHDEFEHIPIRITIEPKMSFGTGHHETTRLMIAEILKNNYTAKKVLDMGCGTGVLGILASIKGAEHVVGIDYDKWAYENTLENIERNKINNMDAILGGKEAIPETKFDVILANINRNILLDQMTSYANSIVNGGKLFLSGILIEDREVIKSCAEQNGFVFDKQINLKKWSMHTYVKG